MLKLVLLDYNPVVHLVNKLTSKVSLLGDLADYVRSLLFNQDDVVLEKLLFLLGVTALTCKTAFFLHRQLANWGWVPSYILNNKNLSGANLKKKYGDCFVVITGFTDGIGHAYAEVFAEMGFNLLLIGRNKEKVDRRVGQLTAAYRNIRIEHVVSDLADFKDLNELQGYFKRYQHLDIGILVNNAGSVAGGPYLQIKPDDILQDINVDLGAIFIINRILIPRMRARGERSAIINIASCTGVFLSTRVGVYSSTKKTLDIYSRILGLENQDKLDVLSVRPFGVSTKMMKMKKGPFMITPRQCVNASLADLLAGEKVTFGHFKHKMSKMGFAYLSEQQRFQLYELLWAKARQQAQ